MWLLDAALPEPANVRPIQIVSHGVVIDVGHTAQNDLHTGIQQVIRRTMPFWASRPETTFVAWAENRAFRALDEHELDRVVRWAHQDTASDDDHLDDDHIREGFSAVSGSGMQDDDGAGGWDEKGHYGPAPEGKQERRGVREVQTSRKEVQLINGELVLECKIPTILYSFLPRRDEIEFTHMRYTAVTCDPDDFVERGYKLRQMIGRTARETELFVASVFRENRSVVELLTALSTRR
jgi:hypothetical protein